MVGVDFKEEQMGKGPIGGQIYIEEEMEEYLKCQERQKKRQLRLYL